MAEFVTETGQRFVNVHSPSDCVGRNCVFHNPSDHSMRGWPMNLRETGLIERLCEHGVGHPDPDSAYYLNCYGPEGAKGTWNMHGCCGCCRAATVGTHTFESIIKRLLMGWVPNHSQGKLVREWWHPAKDIKSSMRHDEFTVIKGIENDLDNLIIRELKEESDDSC